MARRYSQPQIGPLQVNWGNPLALGLIGFVWIGPGGSSSLVGQPLALTESGISRQARKHGIAAVSAGGAADGIYTSRMALGSWQQTALPMSFFAFFDHTTPPATSPLVGVAAATADGFSLIDAYGLRTRRAQVKIGTTSYTAEAGTWTVGSTVRGLTVNGSSLIGYDNGTAFASTATASGAITYDPTYTHFVFLGASPDIAGVAGVGYWLALWNRVLTPSEAMSLAAEPWQLVKKASFMLKGGAASPATVVTLTGPSGGVTGVASTNFTVGANGAITGTVVVTPSDSVAGGTFTPTTVSISSGSPTGTFTYTPASVGAKTISVTNNGALTNPANLTYTATAAATGSIYMAASMSGLGSGGRLFQNPLN